jgi:VanZ family protein
MADSGTPLATLLRWLPAALWAAVIFAGSSIPGSSIASGYSVYGHLSEYAVLATLVMLAERRRGLRTAIVVAVLACAVYGVSDELHQAFTPLRTPDPVDWLTDVAGACLGAAVFSTIALARARWRRRGLAGQ